VDAEQIRRQMKLTRASIDRKLDALVVQTDSAKQHAVQRIRAAAMIAMVATFGVWWWRRSVRG
jgi:hypothetical protein